MPQFLSNTYLVGTPGAEAVFIDAGGPVSPLVAEAERQGLTPTHVLLTHHHHDHVAELGALRERWPGITVLAHPDEAALVEGDVGPITPGEPLEVAGLRIEPLHTPGHTSGMLSFLVEGNVFTGDTLFKGSVGGVRAPGHTTYEDLRRSIMDVLLALPPETVIRPGHTEPDDRRRRARGATPSSGSGAASTPRATSRPPRWASPRRSSCSATTTTAATRRGSAGPTGATTSCPAPRSRGRPATPDSLSPWPTTRSRPRAWPARRGSGGSPPGRRCARSGRGRPTSRATSRRPRTR